MREIAILTIPENNSLRVCSDCNSPYLIADDILKKYVGKFDSIPKRCEKCRKLKRELADNSIEK